MLAFGFAFPDLYARDGLVRLDAHFTDYLRMRDVALFNRLMQARAEPESVNEKDESELLLALAPVLESYLAELFCIEAEAEALHAEHARLNPLYACKRNFVQRRAAKAIPEAEAMALDGDSLTARLSSYFGNAWDELTFATHVMPWLDAPEHAEKLEVALKYAAWALHAPEGQARHVKGVLFKQPQKLDFAHLVPVETEVRHGVTMLKLSGNHYRHREGFALTDSRGSLMHALDQAHYCIYCAHQGRDSCSRGMKEKTGGYKVNPLGIPLAGCPLSEKISEMNELKSQGLALSSLAVVAVDNPMCAGTGHRICNDCMKSCIYQKQQPVDIPLTETRVLDDVLNLPYGFEIYSLLTRWNPLNIRRPVPRPPSGYKVLVAGMGPAGYTLAHHLINDGHTVVGIDGLKIEPLDALLSGVDADGKPTEFLPVKNTSSLREPLDRRVLAGFGGVAEYGITVRWDKNFLKMLRLLLERREGFSLIGGVRFGSQVTVENAFALGFDHIALCMGAGRPTLLGIENGLARGVRTASDFLMSLQLTGAAKADSIANLQLRLPVVVIGGGLTAIDTCTEALAYYPVQVEKFLRRYEIVSAEAGEDTLRARWSAEEREIAEEFLAHARAIRAERAQAEREHRQPDILSLLRRWGGATMAYRRSLADAPSYRLNHEEIEKALEEGIFIAEGLEPLRVEVDAWGHASAIQFRRADAAPVTLPARAVLIAAGTSPNTVLAREDNAIELDGKWFRAVDAEGNPVAPERCAKPQIPHVLMHLAPDGRAVSFFGDLHPSFAGNVVKAMGSAKQGYPSVSAILARRAPVKALPLQGGGLGGGPLFRQHAPELIENARSLRKNMTDAKRRLWQLLSRDQLEGFRFRRQHPIGNYIADFACTKQKLIIELDGGQHDTQRAYDGKRTKFLEAQGYRVLRFWNHELLENGEGVYSIIQSALLTPTPPSPLQGEGEAAFLAFINRKLRARVHAVNRLTPTIVEVVLHAPLAAERFQPGQFYRLQNFETHALKTPDTILAMEGLAMTGAHADPERGLLSIIALEMGGSSDLCAHLKPGEPVVLMGPTGAPTELPPAQTVLLAGGGLGNAVLFSIGRALREMGSKVLYFAGYRHANDRYKVEDIEKAADIIIWCCDQGELSAQRPQDKAFQGNIVEAMRAYAGGMLGDVPIPLSQVNHIIAIGSAGMMKAVKEARHGILQPYLNPDHAAIGSINSPMQCMMKEICAQCLQQHVDPVSGEVTYVYSCFNQDQELDRVSFAHLDARLKQNGVQEKLTAAWINQCLREEGLRN